MPALFLLTLTTSQLDVVRDALATVGNLSTGHFEYAQDWWGHVDGKGDVGTMLRERLGRVGTVAQHSQCRGIKDAPERAKMAWDIAAVIRMVQAAKRLKKPVDYAMLPRIGKGTLARVDCIQSGTRSFSASLESLRDVPVTPLPKKRYPVAPVVPELFATPTKSMKKHSKTRALLKKKVKQHHA